MTEIVALAEAAGLVLFGYDSEGEPTFVGPNGAWAKFEDLCNEAGV